MRARAYAAGIAAFVFVGWGALLAPAANAVSSPSPRVTVTYTKCGDTGWSVGRVHRSGDIDPLAASDSLLEADKLPPRPTNPTILPAWESLVTHPIADVASCSDIASASEDNPGGTGVPVKAPPATAGSEAGESSNTIFDYANWSGKLVRNVNWTQVYATWEVPVATGPDTSRSSQWVGGGDGGSTGPLIQAGTESDPSGYYELWTEVVPNEPTEMARHATNPGDDVAIEVDRTSTGASFFLIDDSAEWEDVYTWTGTDSATDSQVEYIDERPSVTDLFGTQLEQYARQDTTFSGAIYRTTTGYYVLSQAAYDRVDMWSCDNQTELADAGGAVLDGTSRFTVNWLNFGIQEPSPCP